MISKNAISEIRSLHQAKQRQAQGLFIAEGEKLVRELLNSGYVVRIIAGDRAFLDSDVVINPSVTVYEVNDEELERISLLTSPNKVLAVAEIPDPEKPIVTAGAPLTLMIDGLRDPGNLGTIIRTAEWFGLKEIFCSEDTVDCYNPKVVQSTMGSLFRMKINYCPLVPVISASEAGRQHHVYGATLSGKNISEREILAPSLLVMGSESHGISREVLQVIDHQVTIPRTGNSEAESLNAAVATGIMLAAFTK